MRRELQLHSSHLVRELTHLQLMLVWINTTSANATSTSVYPRVIPDSYDDGSESSLRPAVSPAVCAYVVIM